MHPCSPSPRLPPLQASGTASVAAGHPSFVRPGAGNGCGKVPEGGKGAGARRCCTCLPCWSCAVQATLALYQQTKSQIDDFQNLYDKQKNELLQHV